MHQGKTTTSAALIDSNSSITPFLGGRQGGELGTAFLTAHKQHTTTHQCAHLASSAQVLGQVATVASQPFPECWVRPRPVPGLLCLNCPSTGQSNHQLPKSWGFGRAAKSSGAAAQGSSAQGC